MFRIDPGTSETQDCVAVRGASWLHPQDTRHVSRLNILNFYRLNPNLVSTRFLSGSCQASRTPTSSCWLCKDNVTLSISFDFSTNFVQNVSTLKSARKEKSLTDCRDLLSVPESFRPAVHSCNPSFTCSFQIHSVPPAIFLPTVLFSTNPKSCNWSGKERRPTVRWVTSFEKKKNLT